MPIDRRSEFLKSLRGALAPGARVAFCDQLPKTDTGPEIPETDSYQERTLPDGRRFRVIKNFPSQSEMRTFLEPFADDVDFREFPEARRWVVTFTMK